MYQVKKLFVGAGLGTNPVKEPIIDNQNPPFPTDNQYSTDFFVIDGFVACYRVEGGF
jgi:hypothetical protein